MQSLKQVLKTRKVLTLLGIAGGLILLIALFIMLQRNNQPIQRISDAAQAKLYFTPASGQFNNNSQISIDLMLDTLGQNVTGVLAEIQYDNSKLTLDTIEKAGSAFGEDNVTPNPAFADNKVRILADKPEDNPVTGNGKKIATLNFTAKATGDAKLEFVGNNIVEIVNNGTSTNLSVETLPATYTIGNTSPTTIISPEPPTNCLPYGDVDGNGSINNADLSLVSAHINGSGTLTVGQLARADVNRDTVVNQPDYNAIALLSEGKWTTVFPGNPLACPQLMPFHIGFANKKVTLDSENSNPVANNIVIFNPYKLPIKTVTFRGSYNSSAIRATQLTALKGTFAASFPDIRENAFDAKIDFSTPITDEEFEVASVGIIPYTVNRQQSATLVMNSFSTEVVRVGNETVPGSITTGYSKADYTILYPGSTTQSPTNGPTGNPLATSTLIPTINASPPPGGASIRITATLPAIGTVFTSDNKNVMEPNRSVQVQLVRSGSTEPITSNGILAFNGSAYSGYVIVPSITAGSYQIKARLNNTLYKIVPGIYTIQDQSSINTSPVALNSGDINQDNRIDLLDYNIILGCVQQKPSCTQALKKLSDLDSNGTTDAGDYNIFLTQLDIREGD